MTRTALELIGQSGLGYSFDPMTADAAPHPYSKAAKSLEYVLTSPSPLLYHMYDWNCLGSPGVNFDSRRLTCCLHCRRSEVRNSAVLSLIFFLGKMSTTFGILWMFLRRHRRISSNSKRKHSPRATKLWLSKWAAERIFWVFFVRLDVIFDQQGNANGTHSVKANNSASKEDSMTEEEILGQMS